MPSQHPTLKMSIKALFGKSPSASASDLFAKTDPALDGDDCLHDCNSCTVKYPRSFKVEESDLLYGQVKGWQTHLLVGTGKSDWVRDVEDEKGSVMEAIGKADSPSNGVSDYTRIQADGLFHTQSSQSFVRLHLETNGLTYVHNCQQTECADAQSQKLMLSASNIPTNDDTTDYSSPTAALLLPSFTLIQNLQPSNVPALIKSIVNLAPTTTTPLLPAPVPLPSIIPSSSPSSPELTTKPCPHSAVILLCSQRTRDARCGQSAPLLRKEFERHLRPLGLYRDLYDERPGGVGIYFISHVGGHKYSANVMVYRRSNAFGKDDPEPVTTENGTNGENGVENGHSRENGDAGGAELGAAQCIWLARIRPEDCENLIRYTVLKGKVVKPETQLRGGFDRQKGMISW